MSGGAALGTRLDGRRALVTGGLGTIGRAIARALIGAGAEVTVLDRPADGASDARPEGAGWIGQDLADLAATEAAAAAAGPFGILVNNAAIIDNRPFDAFSAEEFEARMRVNAAAAFALARAVAPGMRAARWGRIVHLGSVTLNGEWHGYVPYAASKGALLGLTKGLARELGAHGVTVNAVAPGAVASEAERRVFADRIGAYEAWVLDRQALKARIQPEDVAALVAYLCSDAARMISGQTIAVDGGW